jgi:hypothetical protein
VSATLPNLERPTELPPEPAAAPPPGRVSRARAAVWIAAAAAPVVVGATFLYQRLRDLDLITALAGGSPIQWIYVDLVPFKAAIDWPSASRNYGVSLFMNLYRLLYEWFGVSPETALPGVVVVETLLIAAAFICLTRIVAPRTSPLLAALVVIIALWSSVRQNNLAKFAHPFFMGLYYNAGDAFRIFAIAAFVKDKILWAGLLLAVATAIHPTTGLMTAAFVGAGWLVTHREIPARRAALALLVFVTLTAAWVLVTQHGKDVSGGGIPVERWFALSKMMNFHWYPFDNGSYGNHLVLPYLSLVALLTLAFASRAPLSTLDRRMLAGMAAAALMTLTGMFISKYVAYPFLIKLALHRASDLIVMVGIVYIVADLWNTLLQGGWWRRTLAAVLILSPLFVPGVAGFPLAITVLYALPVFRKPKGLQWLAVVSTAGLIAAAIAYFLTQEPQPLWNNSYIPYRFLMGAPPWLLAVLVLAVAAAWVMPKARPAVLLFVGLVTVFGVNNAVERFPPIDRERSIFAYYKDAQLWARANTRQDALFMPDPTIYYGWRDYSRRASFGNLREWLHDAWVYDSKAAVYAEGLRRFQEFGLPLEKYIALSNVGQHAYVEITADVEKQFYGFDTPRLRDMMVKYGIDYVVLIKSKMQHPFALPTAYENGGIVVLGRD